MKITKRSDGLLEVQLSTSPNSHKDYIEVDAFVSQKLFTSPNIAYNVDPKFPIFGTDSIVYAVYSGVSTIEGGTSSDFLFGGDGKETINGGQGADYMNGGNGDDVYFVDNEADFIDDTKGTGHETVVASVDYSLSNKQEQPERFKVVDSNGLNDLILVEGSAAVKGRGNDSNNSIQGNSNNNILSGELGNGTLTGGGGSDRLNGYGTTKINVSQYDILKGGAGADYFIFGGDWGISYVETGQGHAGIDDWQAGQDKIEALGSSNQYSLTFKNIIGSSALDTEIHYIDVNGNKDLICTLRDTTNVNFVRDFHFI